MPPSDHAPRHDILQLGSVGGDCIAKVAMIVPAITHGVAGECRSQLRAKRLFVSDGAELLTCDIVILDAEDPNICEILVVDCSTGGSDH